MKKIILATLLLAASQQIWAADRVLESCLNDKYLVTVTESTIATTGNSEPVKVAEAMVALRGVNGAADRLVGKIAPLNVISPIATTTSSISRYTFNNTDSGMFKLSVVRSRLKGIKPSGQFAFSRLGRSYSAKDLICKKSRR